MKRALLIILAISQIGASKVAKYGDHTPGVEPVSLIALIARPADYDGRLVRAEGYLNLEFEDAALWLDRAAFDATITRNAVWVDRPKGLSRQNARALGRRYVLVEARFNAGEHGHMGLFSGALTDVRRIAPITSRGEFSRDHGRGSYILHAGRDPRFWLAPILLSAFLGAICFAAFRRRQG